MGAARAFAYERCYLVRARLHLYSPRTDMPRRTSPEPFVGHRVSGGALQRLHQGDGTSPLSVAN